MKIFIADTYEELSIRLADKLFETLQTKKNPLVCVASGDSPKGLYEEMVRRVKKGEADVSSWSFVGLDEWMGMNGNDEGSCRYHLNQQFFHPLQIQEEKICFFDGKTESGKEECNRIENFIRKNGGIDAAIVGLGMNGHVGMNEPGTSPTFHAHTTELHPVTQEVGQKYFKQKQALTGGLTLGLADLIESETVFLVVNGRHKAEVVQKMMEGPVSESLPASLLRPHSNLYIFLDKEAASLLQSQTHES